MSKELTPLEALKELFRLAYGWKTEPTKDYDYYRIIETALKRLEQLEEQFMFLAQANMEIMQEQATNQKKLKALEIINNKDLDIWQFKCYKSLTEYNQNVSPLKWLTEEEYELLKEVLYEKEI